MIPIHTIIGNRSGNRRLLTVLMVVMGLLLAQTVYSLVTSGVPTSFAQSQENKQEDKQENENGEPIGSIHFENLPSARAGKLFLEMDHLAAPPTDSHYEVWLQSSANKIETKTLQLGAITLVDGAVHFSSAQKENLLEEYATFLITLEADKPADNQISNQVVLSATLAKSAVGPLQSFFVPSEQADKGLLFGAAQQLAIVLHHFQLLREVLASSDADDIRLKKVNTHVEHMVNVINGRLGELYGDLNENEKIDDPGDGFGALAYIKAMEETLQEANQMFVTSTSATSQTSASQADAATLDPLPPALRDLRQSQEDGEKATELVARVIAQDTIPEIVEAGYYEKAAAFVTQIDNHLASAYAIALPNVKFVLYANQLVPLDQLPLVVTGEVITGEIATGVAATGVDTTTHDSTTTNHATPHALLAPAAKPPVINQPAPLPNNRWQNPLDGATYVYVQGGGFTMGADKEQTTFAKERPAHPLEVESFWLQATEVTNQQYGLCVQANICSPPKNDLWQQPAYADYPVTHVTWQQAVTYATWAGGRLPSEAEWEHACRANDDRSYPWGNQEPSTQYANFNNPDTGASPVGSYPAGASVDGLLDLSGNVAEWSASLDKAYPYDSQDGREELTTDKSAAANKSDNKRIARGGSFLYSQFQLRCFSRLSLKPSAANHDLGFRVLIELQPRLWQNPLDGASYTYVAGGEFTLGADKNQTTFAKEGPAHTLRVESFWLKTTEVTNQQYGLCFQANVCSPPKNEAWQQPAYADYPVTYLSWEQAFIYATWVGGRLPSEAEWEHACRNNDNRSYPWGNQEPSAQSANFNSPDTGATSVGSYPAGASLDGLLDLSGNVAEWTTSLDKAYPYDRQDGREAIPSDGKRIAHGGSFLYSQSQLRCFSRLPLKPSATDRDVGFRVLLEPSSGK